MNPQEYSGQIGNGVPGGFPLPQGGQKGTAYTMTKMHPAALAAAAPPRQNPANAGTPAMAAAGPGPSSGAGAR